MYAVATGNVDYITQRVVGPMFTVNFLAGDSVLIAFTNYLH